MTETTKEMTQEAAENVNTMISLTQKTAQVTLDGMVQTAQVADIYVQGVVNVGFAAQEAGMNVAKGYFNNISKISQDYINLLAKTGERAIDSAAKLEFSMQKEATEVAKNIVDSAEKIVDNAKEANEKVAAKAAGN